MKVPEGAPSISQTSFEKLKDSSGNVAGKFMDSLQALSPAEDVLVGAVGLIQGVLHIFGQEKRNFGFPMESTLEPMCCPRSRMCRA